MRFVLAAEIQVGQEYHCQHHVGPWRVLREMPPGPLHLLPLFRLQNSEGQQIEVNAAQLTPWSEYLADYEERRDRRDDQQELIAQLAAQSGGRIVGQSAGKRVLLRLSGDEAGWLLDRLGARRPTHMPDELPQDDRGRARRLLSLRLRRAIGAGRVPDGGFQHGASANLLLSNHELQQLLARLEQPDSSLPDLLG